MADAKWGPFTGRQLTTIIVALLATVVLVPGVAWAATTFTNVVIQDAVSGTTAAVTNDKRLTVGDGAGPLSVDGTVESRPRVWTGWATVQLAGGTTAQKCGSVTTPPTGPVRLAGVSVRVSSPSSPVISIGGGITNGGGFAAGEVARVPVSNVASGRYVGLLSPLDVIYHPSTGTAGRLNSLRVCAMPQSGDLWVYAIFSGEYVNG